MLTVLKVHGIHWLSERDTHPGDLTVAHKIEIIDLGPRTIAAVRDAVLHAMDVWPNAHLGDTPPRADLHSAFLFIRSRVAAGRSVRDAANELDMDCFRYHDM
jgi:hypothetical protein